MNRADLIAGHLMGEWRAASCRCKNVELSIRQWLFRTNELNCAQVLSALRICRITFTAHNFHFCFRGKLKFIHGGTGIQIAGSIKLILLEAMVKLSDIATPIWRFPSGAVANVLSSFATKAYYIPSRDSFIKPCVSYSDFPDPGFSQSEIATFVNKIWSNFKRHDETMKVFTIIWTDCTQSAQIFYNSM